MSETDKNGTAIVPVEKTDLQILQAFVKEYPKIAALKAQAISSVREIGLKFTKKRHWTNYRNAPYLRHEGAAVVINTFPEWKLSAITPLPRQEIKHTDGTTEHIFSYSGILTVPGIAEIPGIGVSSTHNDLMGKKAGEYKDPGDINLPNLMSMAFHRVLADAVKQLLDLKNISEDEFKDLTGFNLKDLETVTGFGDAKRTAQKNASPEEKEGKAKIQEMMGLYFGSKEEATAWLMECTGGTGKDKNGNPVKYRPKRNVEDLTGGQVSFIRDKLKRMISDRDAAMGEAQK